jgi:protein phosphatase
MPIQLEAAASTDVGNVRTVNQDDVLVSDTIVAVADGMGGHASGDIASHEALIGLDQAFENDRTVDGLRQAIKWANRAVWRKGTDEPQHHGMGTTLTAVALVEENGEPTLAIANVGDSRTYLLRDGELTQLTSDHSVVQEAVRLGQLSQAEAEHHPARNRLTRALGIESDLEVDMETVDPVTGDRLLLCSDGLWDELPPEAIASILKRKTDAAEAADELVAQAKDAGGRDNITVIVVDVIEAEDRAKAEAASAALAEGNGGVTDPTTEISVIRAEPPEPPEPDKAKATHEPPPAILKSHETELPPPAVATRRQRLITWRVVAFAAAVVAIVIVAAVALRAGEDPYRVKLQGSAIVIVEDSTVIGTPVPVDVSRLDPPLRRRLEKGAAFTDFRDAETQQQQYVAEAVQAGAVLNPGGGQVRVETTSTVASTSTTATTVAVETTVTAVVGG